MINKDYIINLIRKENVKDYLNKHGIEHISLFWSYARWDMTDESDIDLLYQKKNNIKFSLLDRINIINYLSNIFQKKIDIVNKDSINFRIKDEILKNKIDII